ncbi:MAG: inositol monophosphatase family protein [Anaerolineae bacterium]
MTDPALFLHLRETAVLAAQAAAAVIRQHSRPVGVYEKGPGDLVTDTDRLAQEAALAAIQDRHPAHTILAEEDSRNHITQDGRWLIPPGVTWSVDPLDGTTNYAFGIPFYCVSVGAALDGEPVAGAIYDPLRDELFVAARGAGVTLNGELLPPLQPMKLPQAVIGVGWAYEAAMQTRMVHTISALAFKAMTVRSLGSAALSLAYVAAGRLGMYLNFGLKPWDTGAAAVMIGEVGGVLIQPDGRQWQFGDPAFLTGHPALLADALQALD